MRSGVGCVACFHALYDISHYLRRCRLVTAVPGDVLSMMALVDACDTLGSAIPLPPAELRAAVAAALDALPCVLSGSEAEKRAHPFAARLQKLLSSPGS